MSKSATLISSLALAMGLAGCPQQESTAPPADQGPRPVVRQGRDQTDQVQAAVTARADARRPAVVPSPAPPAADAGPAAGEQLEELAPMGPYKKMNEHMHAIFDIMSRNKDDCDKAAGQVEAYAAEHRAEMGVLSKQVAELTDKLSEADRSRFKAWAMRSGQQMIQKSMGVMMLFHQKCPKQMQRINKQVLSMSGT